MNIALDVPVVHRRMVIVMEKLFAAIRDMHPEAEVLDVRFQVSNNCSIAPSLSDIDQGFADVVLRDKCVTIHQLAS